MAAPRKGSTAIATSRSAKQNYIRRIRAQTAYPTFRSLITILAVLLYLLGAFFIGAGLVAGLVILGREGAQGIGVILGGVIAGLIYIIIGKFSKEAAFMLADIADSMTDLNSRYDQQQ